MEEDVQVDSLTATANSKIKVVNVEEVIPLVVSLVNPQIRFWLQIVENFAEEVLLGALFIN